jgi:hypothetical protein
VGADGRASLVRVDPGPPLGAGDLRILGSRGAAHQVLDHGDALLLVSDGMFERRDEAVDDSLLALARQVPAAVADTPDVASALQHLLARARPALSEDDATMLLLRRM